MLEGKGKSKLQHVNILFQVVICFVSPDGKEPYMCRGAGSPITLIPQWGVLLPLRKLAVLLGWGSTAAPALPGSFLWCLWKAKE